MALFFECRPDLKLPLVFRVQVGSEATGPILLADNAISMRKIRPGADCFAALDVLPVAPLREHLQSGGHYWHFARVRAPRDDCLAQSVSWTSHVHADRLCKYIFRESAR